MKEYYYEIKSIKKVAKKFGWSDKTVRKYIEPIRNFLTPE